MFKHAYDRAEFRRWLIGGSVTTLFGIILFGLQQGAVGRILVLPLVFAGGAMIAVAGALFDPGSRFGNNVIAGAVYATQVMLLFISAMIGVFKSVDSDVQLVGSAVLAGGLLLMAVTVQKIRSVRSAHLAQVERREFLEKLAEGHREINGNLEDLADQVAGRNVSRALEGGKRAISCGCARTCSKRNSRLVFGLAVGAVSVALAGVGVGVRLSRMGKTGRIGKV